jgi:hypothetical protein
MEMARKLTLKTKRKSKTIEHISTKTKAAIHNLRQKDETMVTTHPWMPTLNILTVWTLNA